MKNLIIDAANDKIVFSIITEKQSYTTAHTNCRENFDKFINLLSIFLNENKILFELHNFLRMTQVLTKMGCLFTFSK